jgi:type II secretory pathway component HofQ
VASACESLEATRLAEVRLVAVVRRDGADLAYLVDERGDLWPVKPGQRLLDGVIEAVGADALRIRIDGGSPETRRLFAGGGPPTATFDPKEFTGAPVSVDLDADVSTLAHLVADVSGLPVVLEAGLTARVRVAGRDAPWDGLVARAITEAGLAHRVASNVLVIGRAGRVASLSPAPASTASGKPVSLYFRNADVRDLARPFEDMSGLAVRLPEASCGPLTIFVTDMPWDVALAWVVASCGWTHRVEGGAIVVEAAGAK